MTENILRDGAEKEVNGGTPKATAGAQRVLAFCRLLDFGLLAGGKGFV